MLNWKLLESQLKYHEKEFKPANRYVVADDTHFEDVDIVVAHYKHSWEKIQQWIGNDWKIPNVNCTQRIVCLVHPSTPGVWDRLIPAQAWDNFLVMSQRACDVIINRPNWVIYLYLTFNRELWAYIIDTCEESITPRLCLIYFYFDRPVSWWVA